MNGDFGNFIRQKRTEQNITLRKLANDIGIVPAYMSDIEKGRRYPPDKEKLFKIADVLGFSEDERNIMFDLAAREKVDTVSQDISDYIMDEDIVRVALRVARDNNIPKEKWAAAIKLFCED